MALPNTNFGSEKIARMLRGCRAVWMIGIGGVSMCSLAELSLQLGFAVGGSDRTDGERLDHLRSLGAEIRIGHGESIPAGYGVVVYTVAISEANPEYCAALRGGIPLISRADYLGFLMSLYRERIGIAGMHGKSTCTAMCATAFETQDPTVFCGAELPAFNNHPCRIGSRKEHFIFEACEYMDSFLHFLPTVAVILNIGLDHVDYFHSMEQIRKSFLHFANLVGESGTVIYNADDPECVRTLESCQAKKMTFSTLHPDADFYADRIRAEHGKLCFDYYEKGEQKAELSIHVCGKHNVYNALAAMGAARICGIPVGLAADSLHRFRGVKRRMELRGYWNGAPVYDDYAHHPDEIRATLAGAKALGYERILCVYQPHTYSRTAGLFEEFATAFRDADRVLFADIYAARETNESGVSSEKLASAVRENGVDASWSGTVAATAGQMQSEIREGDLVLVMGAGDIENLFSIVPLTEIEE